MKETVIRKCKQHGETIFTRLKNGRYMCLKCNSESSARNIAGKKARLMGLLGGICQVCGYDYYDGALDFHHIDPKTKSFSIGKNISKPWKELRTEVMKCALLCANCHRELHGGIIHLTDKIT
jgi:5-methylcytosine-specific restriction endonuclease McrA